MVRFLFVHRFLLKALCGSQRDEKGSDAKHADLPKAEITAEDNQESGAQNLQILIRLVSSRQFTLSNLISVVEQTGLASSTWFTSEQLVD